MSKRLLWIGLPLAVAVIGAVGLFAARGLADEREGPGGPWPQWGHEAPWGHWGHDGPWGHWGVALMEGMDADGNGTLSSAEVETFVATRAAEVDADKDGTITVEELDAWIEQQRLKRMAERLARMDSDGNGTVTVEEFRASHVWRMARLDRDGDGTIEPDEMRRRGWMHRDH
jgi:hypothetical protein